MFEQAIELGMEILCKEVLPFFANTANAETTGKGISERKPKVGQWPISAKDVR
jgi:hypothetical protein